jgi:hypothetical protein
MVDSYNKTVWNYESLSPLRWSLRPSFYICNPARNDGVGIAPIYFVDEGANTPSFASNVEAS